MTPWLHVLGIGEDGLEGLSSSVRVLINSAEFLIGGSRHLEKIPPSDAKRLTWRANFPEVLEKIKRMRGRRVVVLASGDPMWFGVGVFLAKHLEPNEMKIHPVAGAFSLAAARLGWPLSDTNTLTIHGRRLDSVLLYLAPREKLLILSTDGRSPAKLARRLKETGWGASFMVVLEHLGGERERRLEGTAKNWPYKTCADLNVIAVLCISEPNTQTLSRVPGLPDAVFEHDGQITKREIRALTISALIPLPGRMLWDLGAGTGSIAIEWLRAQTRTEAIAIEHNAERAARIARNAANLGVPHLEIEHGNMIEVITRLNKTPDVIFLGGNVSKSGLLELCWNRLPSGGRLVANAVSLEAEAALIAFQKTYGGNLIRIAIERTKSINKLSLFKPLHTITQYIGDKV